MERTLRLKNEFSEALMGTNDAYTVFKAEGYRSALGESIPVARATAIQSLFSCAIPHVYRNDLIVGSHRLHRVDTAAYDMDAAKRIVKAYGERSFATNLDHYCPDYTRFLSDGIPGTLRRISESKER